MRRFGTLTFIFAKSYLRDRLGIFFSVLVPIIITVLFGLMNFGGSAKVSVGVVDEASNAASARFADGLRQVSALDVHGGTRDEELRALQRGERDMVLVFPDGFAPSPTLSATILVYEHAGRPQQVSVGRAVLTQVVDQATFAAVGSQPIARFETQRVDANKLTYVDFLIPGMVALSIMQLGIFTVAFGVVQAKRLGVLRRLMATPLRPVELLAAQTVVRLGMVLAQVLVLVGLGVVLFKYTLVGNFVELVVVGVLGGLVFLALGYAIAGRARSEEQAAPLANLVSMPQMFLSGIFFGREALPTWLKPISDVFPLTFLADAAREVSTQGAHLWDVRGDILGLLAWLAIAFVAAVKLFRFE